MSSSLFDLNGKTALVTGGARGIGEAIGRALAGAGARVMIGDIDDATAAQTAQEMSRLGPDCRAMRLDVSDEASVAQGIAETARQFGRLDILVNNAGINTLRDRVTIERFSNDDWRAILSVDLDGVFYMSRAAVPTMRQAGGGRIINIASVLGMVPARLQSAYVAAKAAVINLTKSMALELAPDGILVNAIAPGSTLTIGTRKLLYSEDAAYSERAQSLLSHIPLGRPASRTRSPRPPCS